MSGWQGLSSLSPRQYVCAYCGNLVATKEGYFLNATQINRFIYICPKCEDPTYFRQNEQLPSPVLGNPVHNLPDDVGKLYDEARKCTASGGSTAAVLLCRKLLMHLAVEKGDKPGKNFAEYVEYLGKSGYVPPGATEWVDHIRAQGNEANHEIKFMSPSIAQELLQFLEMLLKFIYEYPAKMKAKKTGP